MATWASPAVVNERKRTWKTTASMHTAYRCVNLEIIFEEIIFLCKQHG